MRNDEAAIIALCRSKSQNLSGIPLDRDGYVSWGILHERNWGLITRRGHRQSSFPKVFSKMYVAGFTKNILSIH